MLIFYNIIQLLTLLIFAPFLLVFVLSHSKYRSRTPSKLGLGLRKQVYTPSIQQKTGPTFWIHALSVGETTSAEPLIKGLRQQFQDCTIVFSVTTKSGRGVADTIMTELADSIIDGPFDILPVVLFFHRTIRPDMFILVETDFWPNNLLLLKKAGVPTLLVNGRVSDNSIKGYNRFPFFFRPMFQSFSFLCMQTEGDKRKMTTLGIDKDKILTLGNLKFDTPKTRIEKTGKALGQIFPTTRQLFICGSTHPGEEEILMQCYKELQKDFPELLLVIAPRNIYRAKEIETLAKSFSLSVTLRSNTRKDNADLVLLDTIGELSACYSLATISFVGGSFVAKGGHNPIEPAAQGVPVLFGPHMEDFSEISQSLVECGGASQVGSSKELVHVVSGFLLDENARKTAGDVARQFILSHKSVIDNHIALIKNLI